MKIKIIEQLNERKEVLVKSRDQYTFENEKREIETLEVKINDLVMKMNSKKTIYDGYQKDIDKIDMTISNINDIIIDEIDDESGENIDEEIE